ERDVEVQADDTVSLPDRLQLLVGEVPSRRTDRVSVRMRGDQGGVTQLDDVPEAAFADVREVDKDLELVAALDEPDSVGSQARCDVRGGGEREGHPVTEQVGPAPNDP